MDLESELTKSISDSGIEIYARYNNKWTDITFRIGETKSEARPILTNMENMFFRGTKTYCQKIFFPMKISAKKFKKNPENFYHS